MKTQKNITVFIWYVGYKISQLYVYKFIINLLYINKDKLYFK